MISKKLTQQIIFVLPLFFTTAHTAAPAPIENTTPETVYTVAFVLGTSDTAKTMYARLIASDRERKIILLPIEGCEEVISHGLVCTESNIPAPPNNSPSRWFAIMKSPEATTHQIHIEFVHRDDGFDMDGTDCDSFSYDGSFRRLK